MARIALTPQGSLIKTRLADDTVVYGRNRPGFGGRGVYIFRERIEPEFEHLTRFISPGDVFVDVGANTGIYTLRAARTVDTVIALEPYPDVMALLSKSVAANGFANVRLRTLCASDRTGQATVWRNFGKPNSFSLVKRDPKAIGFSTLTVTLDDLMAWEGIERIDYLKIDAEGSEREVLEGAARVLKTRPIVQVEISVKDPSVPLDSYVTFRARDSGNRVLIPRESPRIQAAVDLGWTVC